MSNVPRLAAFALSIAPVAACGGGLAETHVIVPIGGPTPAATTVVKSFRSVEVGRVVVGADLLDSRQAAGQWHTDVVVEDGRATRIEHVGPSTLRSESTYVTYGTDGSQTRVHSDAYGVETYTERLASDGDRSRVYRSGAANERGCARIHETYEVHDLAASATCLDVDGRVVTDAEGCAVRRFDYDARQRLHRERCFAEDGTPAVFRLGGHALVVEYDSLGYREKVTRTNADGIGAADESGCVAMRYSHDHAGNVVLATCLDAGGRAHGMNGTDAVSTRTSHDLNGCTLEEASLGAAGALVAVLGVARRVYERDRSCGELSLVQLDANGEHAAPALKVSSYEYVRNAAGLVIEQHCHDAQGGPTACRDAMGVEGAIVRSLYDDRGREVVRRGFTVADAPSKMSRGYPHEWRFAYAPDGISNEVSYFDEQGLPALANGTVAKHAFVFDRLGSLTNAKSLDANGRPARPTTGCADIRRSYDTSHRLASIECRGTDDALAASNLVLNAIRWPPQSARVVVERSGNGVAANAYFATDGRLLERVACGADRCFR